MNRIKKAKTPLIGTNLNDSNAGERRMKVPSAPAFAAAILAATLALSATATAMAYETDEIPSNRTGGVLIEQKLSNEAAMSMEASSQFPESYSSLDMSYVTPAKNQSSYNSCIFFAAASAMETALLKSGFGEYDLSEEYGNYWGALRLDGTGWQRNRIRDGAYAYTGYGWLTGGGVTLEEELPYMSRSEQYFEQLPELTPSFYATGVEFLDRTDGSDKFKAAIMEHGGVATSFVYNDRCMNTTTSSYYTSGLSASEINSGAHATFIVGWDDNYSRLNFNASNRPSSDGAWLVKNSWGAYLDFFWISYEDAYLTSAMFGYSYAVTDVTQNHSCNELLQIEEYGPMYGMTFSSPYVDDSSDITFINTYEFDCVMNTISTVEFTTYITGADYTLYYIPTEDGAPVNDRSRWTELGSGTIEERGIQSIEISPFTVPDNFGAIGVNIDTSDPNLPAAIGCCEWLTVDDGISSTYVFLPNTLENRSFIVSADRLTSLSDYYSDQDDTYGGNFSIKAVMNVRAGDVDKSGTITVADAIEVQRHIANLSLLDSDTRRYVADLNQDETITVADAISIQRIIANIL